MRIREVIVKRLFGTFNHTVPLNTEKRITIIHGPNGFGKTILLKMIHAFFNRNYHELMRIPFDEFSVGFDDKTNLHLRKHAPSQADEKQAAPLTVELIRNGSKLKSIDLKMAGSSEAPLPMRFIEREIERAFPYLERIGPETWLSLRTQEEITLEELAIRFQDRLPFLRRYVPEFKEPEWLQDIRKSVPVRFVEAQRLLTFVPRRHEYEDRLPMIPVVGVYSEELANAIQAKLAEYGTLSQSLDRTFPTRLIKRNKSTDVTIEAIRNNLTALEGKRSRLMAAGLLDKQKEVDLGELTPKVDQTNRTVLSVYVEDVKKKLEVFDELTNKIDLLINIINSRFFYKTMSVNKKSGFVFRSSAEDDLSPTMLSSGEQHEIVLLYELLFKVNPGSLILVDEPELSLHVLWQQQFLRDLQRIIQLGGFDVLIATHSPQIIHDRWDLTVELKGPESEKLPNTL